MKSLLPCGALSREFSVFSRPTMHCKAPLVDKIALTCASFLWRNVQVHGAAIFTLFQAVSFCLFISRSSISLRRFSHCVDLQDELLIICPLSEPDSSRLMKAGSIDAVSRFSSTVSAISQRIRYVCLNVSQSRVV